MKGGYAPWAFTSPVLEKLVITQGGVRSIKIFSSDEDRREYLSLLNAHGEKER